MLLMTNKRQPPPPALLPQVDSSEACILTNTFRGTTDFSPKIDAARIAASPWHELICYPTTIVNLVFQDGRSGLERQLSVRASDGLSITLDMEVDVRIRPNDVGRLIQLFGKDALNQARRVVRSAARNAAAAYPTTSFLTGQRVNVSESILDAVQTDMSPFYIDVLRVNLLVITVPSEFLDKFEAVEQVRLDVREEVESLPVRQATTERRNQTGIVDLEAARRTALINAERQVTAAELAQQNALVTEETRQQRERVIEETTRVQLVAAAEAAVDRSEAEAAVNVSTAQLVAGQRELEASRTREVRIANAEREVAEARASADALVAEALTLLQTAQVEQATRRSLAFAAARRTEIEAAGEATGVLEQGAADAAVARASTLADLSYLIGAAANNWTEHQAGAGLHFRTVGAIVSNATAFLDYQRGPLSLEVQRAGAATPASGVLL